MASVRKRGDKYEALWRDANGRQDSKSGFRSVREAKHYGQAQEVAVREGRWTEPSKQTVGAFLDSWLASIRAAVRPSTLDSYRRNTDLHVRPHIGGLALQKLAPEHLNSLYATLLERGRMDGHGGLSPKSIRNIATLLHKALSDAVRWGHVGRNVAALAEPPAASASRPAERSTWTAEEVRSFLTHVERDRLEAAWVLAATTGMRRGEVLGLRWQDLDLDHDRLSIRQTLVSVAYEAQLSTPKTHRSARVVDLDPVTVATLRAHRAHQVAERLAWGPAYEDSGLVFTRENGHWVHPDRFTQMFDKHVKRSGLPRIRLHDLRHTYATISLRAGVRAEVVSRRLGHATVAFTQDVYTHAIPAMQEEAANKVAGLIFGD